MNTQTQKYNEHTGARALCIPVMSKALPFFFAMGLAFVMSGQPCSAKPLLDESFDKPLTKDLWTFTGTPRTSEGRLELNAKTDAPSGGINCGISNNHFGSDLNFFKNDVEMVFTDLNILTDVAPENSIFIFAILSDANAKSEIDAKSYVKFRLTANGQLLVVGPQTADNGTRTERGFINLTVTLPIKKLAVKFNPSGMQLSVEDAERSQNATAEWKGRLDAADWSEASQPQLFLKAVRRQAGTGGCTVLLDNLQISSEATH